MQLEDSIKKEVDAGRISVDKAELLTKVEGLAQVQFAARIISEGLSLVALKRLIDGRLRLQNPTEDDADEDTRQQPHARPLVQPKVPARIQSRPTSYRPPNSFLAVSTAPASPALQQAFDAPRVSDGIMPAERYAKSFDLSSGVLVTVSHKEIELTREEIIESLEEIIKSLQ